MSIYPSQLRGLIADVLYAMESIAQKPGILSHEAIELLMLTAAQESHCGAYIKQVRGPALGIFQMEPATCEDLFMNYLRFQPDTQKAVDHFITEGVDFKMQMMGNIPMQIVFARAQYRRFPERIPSNSKDIARYYKKYWNTEKGKATVEEALRNYDKYAF